MVSCIDQSGLFFCLQELLDSKNEEIQKLRKKQKALEDEMEVGESGTLIHRTFFITVIA